MAGSLTVWALEEGTWGDRLSIEILEGSLDPENSFNLVIRYKGEVVEIFKDLSLSESSTRNVEMIVNERSEFVTVEVVDPQAFDMGPRPELGACDLSGGDDGLADLEDTDFIGDPSQHTGFFAFDEIDALNMVAIPGVTTAEVIHAGIAYAENRQDLMLLADKPLTLKTLS